MAKHEPTGRTFTRRTKAPAAGNLNGQRRSVAIGFDPALFVQIRAMAGEANISFSEQVRRLCEAALKSGR